MSSRRSDQNVKKFRLAIEQFSQFYHVNSRRVLAVFSHFVYNPFPCWETCQIPAESRMYRKRPYKKDETLISRTFDLNTIFQECRNKNAQKNI